MGSPANRGDVLFRILLCLVVAAALVAPAIRAFEGLPYYHHGDEGHLLLWTGTILAGEAPDNIFYGPLLYYVYLPAAAVGDGVAALTDHPERFYTPLRLSGEGARPAFHDDFHPSWMLPVARGYSMAFFALALFAVAAFLKAREGKTAALVGALTLASVPFAQRYAAFAQPEAAILGLGCVALLYADRRARTGFSPWSSLLLGLLISALAALKLYTLLYAGLGWVVLRRAQPERRRLCVLTFVVAVLGGTLLLYLPYRSPRAVIRVMSWAMDYYDTKPPGSLVRHLLTGNVYTGIHLALFAFGAAALALPGRRLVPTVAAALAAANLAYFERYDFVNPRNVVLLAGIGAIVAGRGVGRALDRMKGRTRRVVGTVALLILAGLLLSVSHRVATEGNQRPDHRLRAAEVVRRELGPEGRVFVSNETGIHDITLPRGRFHRFRQSHPPVGLRDEIRHGDLIVVREREGILPADWEQLLAGSERIERFPEPRSLAIYRLGAR